LSDATNPAITTAAMSQVPARSRAGCQTANTPVPTMALTPTTTAPPNPSDRVSRLGGSLCVGSSVADTR
jgi:hypothetical protein